MASTGSIGRRCRDTVMPGEALARAWQLRNGQESTTSLPTSSRHNIQTPRPWAGVSRSAAVR
jgi:hypothetical protein